MNKLSTKDNKNYCIYVAMLAVINVFIFIYKLSTAFPHLKWDAHNVMWSIYNILGVLSYIIAMISFVTLALLVVLQAFNLCSDKIVRIVFKSYIIFYSSYALFLFIVEQGRTSEYYTVFHSFEIILLTIFIILFAKTGEKTEKSKAVLLIVVLSFLLLSIIMSMLTISDSNNMFLICCIGRIIVSIAMVTSFCKNKMDNNILKIIGGLFLLLSFIDGISVLVMYKTFTVSLFIYFLSMVLQALPIFLYFLFYSRINTQGEKRKKHGIEGQLADLKEKLDSGLITLDEYNTVKQNILSKINIG
ncbi:MAG: SHOCT domain-containing protein [Acutalibacteraceae bacterium]